MHNEKHWTKLNTWKRRKNKLDFDSYEDKRAARAAESV